MEKNNNSKYYLNLNDLLEENFEKTDPVRLSYLDTVNRRFTQYDTHKKSMKVMATLNKFLKKHEKNPNKFKLDAKLDPKWDQMYFGAMSILSKNNKSAEFLLNEDYLKTVTNKGDQARFVKRMGRLRNKFNFDKKHLDNVIEGLGYGKELKDMKEGIENRVKNKEVKLSKKVIDNNTYENLSFNIEHKDILAVIKREEEMWRAEDKARLKENQKAKEKEDIEEKIEETERTL